MRARLRGREELAARVQQTLALPTKREAEMVVDTVVTALESTLLNNLGYGRIHPEAQRLRQILRATQAGDSPENRVHGRDHPDEGAAEGQVRQSGESSAAGARWLTKKCPAGG